MHNLAETSDAIPIFHIISPHASKNYTAYILIGVFALHHTKPYHLITLFLGT
jgi:hypothetical protein